MENTKKIITRAVYGTRAQAFRNSIRIAVDEAERMKDILGCAINGARVLNAAIEGDDIRGKKVRADVEFEIHIWYRTDQDTKVYKANAKSSDIIEVEKQGTGQFSQEDVKVWMKENPKYIDAAIVRENEGNLVAVQLEYVLEAEIVGETLLNVKVF